MPIIALSVTEAELFAAVQCAMDMLFAMRVLNAMGLKVELPMVLEVDNKGAVDLCNNWSIGGRTRHVEVKQYFLRELKERGLIMVKWTSGESMTSDLFTKNLVGPLFDKHAQSFVGHDKYMMAKGDVKWVEETHHVIPKGRVSEGLESSAGYNARTDKPVGGRTGNGSGKSKVTDIARSRGTENNGRTRRVSKRDKSFGNKALARQIPNLVKESKTDDTIDNGIDESNWVEVDPVEELRNEVGEPISYGSEYDWEYLSVWSDICE